MAHKLTSKRWLVVIAVAALFTMMAQPMTSPPPAQAAQTTQSGILDPCNYLGSKLLKTACEAAKNTAGIGTLPGIGGLPGIGSIPGVPDPGGILSGAVGTVAGGVFDQIVQAANHAENKAVAWLLKETVNEIVTSLTPDFAAKWLGLQLGFVYGIGILVAIGLWIGRFVRSILRNDPEEVARSTIAAGTYVTLGGFIPVVIAIATYFCDGVVAPAILKVSGKSPEESIQLLLSQYEKAASSTGVTGLPELIPLVFLFFGFIGAIVFWLIITYRFFALYIMVPITVLILSTIGSETGEARAMKAIRLDIGLIVLKDLVLFVYIFFLLAAVNTNPGATPLLEITGGMALAPFIAWGLFKEFGDHHPPIVEVVQKGVSAGTTIAAIA